MNIMSKHSYTCHFVIYNDGEKSSLDTIQYLTSNSFASRVNSLRYTCPLIHCCVGAVLVCAVFVQSEGGKMFSRYMKIKFYCKVLSFIDYCSNGADLNFSYLRSKKQFTKRCDYQVTKFA